MPVKSEIKNGIVYTQLSGEINYDVVCQHVDYIASLKDKINNLYELSDFTHVTKINLPSEDMRKISCYIEQSGEVYSHSFIAYHVVTEFQFGMARMFKSNMELAGHQIEIHIFEDREKALQFLKDGIIKYGY